MAFVVAGFIRSHKALVSLRRDLPRTRASLSLGKQRFVEKVWREFFSDPSQWWDNRSAKVNERYPDFKHKKTQEGLWINGKLNPPWVGVELAAMVPGIMQVDIFSWNKRLTEHVQTGQYKKAIELFQQMTKEGMNPDTFSFVRALNACTGLQDLEEGRCIHTQIIQSGYQSDVYVCGSLIDMYSKCGSINDAQIVFDKMTTHNVVSWNVMILGYVKCGQGEKALEVFRRMELEGVEPDAVTFVGMLKACASAVALEEGRWVHGQIIQHGFESNVVVGNSLINMYAKCGSIGDAWTVFNKMQMRNVVSWSTMILGSVQCGQGEKALELSQQMQQEGVEPNPVTFVGMLNACASVALLDKGRLVHEQIIQKGFGSNVIVGNSLIDMYVKCDSIEDAWRVFNEMTTRNVVAWTAMILGLVKCGQGLKALKLWREMQQEGVEPNAVMFVALLSACTSVLGLEDGRLLHEQIIQSGCESDVFVSSGLIDMYAKCGIIEHAQRVFDKMLTRNVVSWNVMILGYVKCGQGQKALELFQRMQCEGVEPDPSTFVGMLNACASVGALEEGRRVHEQIIQRGLESDVFIGNSLVDMYSKCGSIEDAWTVFNKMPMQDVVTWTAMLGGYATHGYAKEAFELFEQMCREGVEMNKVTFISLLSACSHTGLVDEGLHYFEFMSKNYNISATVEHYTCIVDLLGRAGHLHEAEDVIKKMPYEPIFAVLISLLGSCRIHGYVELGERIAERVFNLDPENAAGYILLSNIYAAAGKRDSSAKS